ncbi:hypothetical protein [Halorussus halobius]|uniref:hypothetical protein n=1 Tax=Halorussus halobius TaxID=1710537 RepID=UPI001092EBA9|nr:hypothetical protein [Halorussus halobius]
MSDPEFGEREYLCYRLLAELDEAAPNAISRSKFHKLSCLVARHLDAEFDHDAGLPRYWYVYGEVVDERTLEGEFYIAPSANHWPGRRYLPADDVCDWHFAVPDERKAVVDEAVDWAVERFASSNAEAIGKHFYRKHVPNEFVRTYNRLRERLERVDLDEQSTLGDFGMTDHSTRGFVVDSLERMVDTYPRDDYPEAYELFVEWHDTVELLVDADDPDYAAVEEFLDSFITMLSKVELRFHHRQHIPDERIRAWEDERLDAKETFAAKLTEKRRDLLDGRSGVPPDRPDREGPADSPGDASVSFSRRLDSFD